MVSYSYRFSFLLLVHMVSRLQVDMQSDLWHFEYQVYATAEVLLHI